MLISAWLAGGAAYALGGADYGGAVLLPKYMRMLLISGAAAAFLPRLVRYYRLRRALAAGMARLYVSIDGAEYELCALRDSGCFLTEPVTGAAVVIAHIPALLGAARIPVPLSTINGQGIIYALKPDRMRIDGTDTDALLAISAEPISGAEAIVPSRLAKGEPMNILNKARELIRRIIEGIYCALGLGMPVHYVNSGEALPPPLSKQEEAECIGALAAGDESMRRVLIERNLRLVVYIARKFENTGVNIEDLISIGAIGLIKAVNTFDAGKKIKLATYASRCIENEILMHLRRSSKLKMEVSLDEPLNIDWDGNELLLSDILGTDNDLVCRDIEDEVDKELLNIAMNRLNPREKRIMELRFGLGGRSELTQKQVADMMGISQSYISRLEKHILKTLKREMQQMSGI